VSEHAKHRQAGLVERVAARLPDPVFARTIALVHPRVEPEMRRVIAACPRDGTAVDVGAWYGPWTRWLSRHMDAVVAFEANPKVAAVLRATAPSNAVIHAVAVSDRDGETLELAVSGGRGREGRSSVEARLAEGSERVRVPTRRLDSFDLDRVRMIKVDVEGHELAVLRGARELLERDHPVLVVEVDSRLGDVDPVMDWLHGCGYRSSALSGGKWFEIGSDELVHRQRSALVRARRSGYLASAFRGPNDFVNNVVFVHPDSGWQPS
jgi:FkbM family methyltransferase